MLSYRKNATNLFHFSKFVTFSIFLFFSIIYSFKSDVLELLKKQQQHSKVQSSACFIGNILSISPKFFNDKPKLTFFLLRRQKMTLRLVVMYDYLFLYVWLGLPRRALSRLLTVVNCLYYVAYIQYFKKHMW